jgi:hypothetical protein
MMSGIWPKSLSTGSPRAVPASRRFSIFNPATRIWKQWWNKHADRAWRSCSAGLQIRPARCGCCRARSQATSIYAGPAAARTAFRALAGAASEGVRCPQMTTATASEEGPDYAALACYDAVRLTAAAIRTGGLNRIRICRALARLSPWQGAAGEIRWSALNRNSRPVSAGSFAMPGWRPLTVRFE